MDDRPGDAGGGGCSGVTGDSSGNVYASAYTCVDGTEPGVEPTSVKSAPSEPGTLVRPSRTA